MVQPIPVMRQEASNVDTALNLNTSRDSMPMPIGAVDPIILINEKPTGPQDYRETILRSGSDSRAMSDLR